jgi:hypothetical protein
LVYAKNTWNCFLNMHILEPYPKPLNQSIWGVCRHLPFSKLTGCSCIHKCKPKYCQSQEFCHLVYFSKLKGQNIEYTIPILKKSLSCCGYQYPVMHDSGVLDW